jgi:8-oxo-dGTP pyrophosphatase MutT (NUDIX family)
MDNKYKQKIKLMLRERFETKYAGVLIKSLSTNKVLLLYRSEECSYPLTWGLCSGGVNQNEDTLIGLKREITEELSIDPDIITYEFKYTEDANGIDFYYYEGFVENEFEPTLNFENLEYRWCNMSNIPTPLYEKLQDKIEMLLK